MAQSRRIAGITIEIDGNTTKLNSALKDVDKQLGQTQKDLKDVERLLKLDPRNTELLTQKQKLLTDAVKGSRERLAELQKAAEQLAEKDSTPEVQRQQDALQREIIETKNNLKEFEKELGKIPNKASQAFDAVGSKLKDVGGKISTVGTEMTKMVTGPIAAVGTGAVAAFTEVDDAMDQLVIKTGATGSALEEMEGIVENMATTIPTDFNTAAQAVGEVNTRFGLMGSELEDLSTAFVQFSQLNQTDVSGSIDIVSSMMAAFGLEAKDAKKVLDRLNATAQRTGIKVDRLADVVQNNASALQEMGMTAADAIDFLGDVEVSGADVGVVMAGLRNAYKKAAKEGRPLNDVLKDFDKVMKSSKSDTEKTQEAIELFGSKAGTAIKNAAEQGTLSFDKLGASLETTAGNVEKTFEGTVDPIDNFKMAMNELKLVGADVGAMLSEFAGPILQKVRDGLSKALEAWRGLNEDQQNTIIKAAGVVAAIGPVVTVVGKLTQGIGLLSQGIGVLVAHPVAALFIGATAAIAGAVIAVKNHTDAVKAAYEEEYGLSEAMRDNIEAVNAQYDAYTKLDEAKDEALETIDAEYKYVEDLVTEYNSLVDENGKVKEGYEERAEVIKTTLADAMGVEKKDINDMIDANGKLGASIDAIIEKKKAESFLSAYQDEYTEAVKNSDSALDNLTQAEADYKTKADQVSATEAKLSDLRQQVTSDTSGNVAAVQELNDEIGMLEDQLATEQAAMDAERENVEKARTTYEGLQTTIKNYEGLSSSVVEGDAQKISDSLDKMRTDFATTETASVDTLKNQKDKMEKEYNNMKTAVENGAEGITEADLEEKRRWYQLAKNEYDKATRLANTEGGKMGSEYSKGINSKKTAVQIAAEKVADAGLGKLDVDTYGTGQNFAVGFADGMWAKVDDIKNRARALANEAKRQMEYTLEVQSPSKVMKRIGQYFTEGFALGITDKERQAIQAAENLANDTVISVEGQQNMAAANPYFNERGVVNAFKSALSQMYIEMDNEKMGQFVESTVSTAIYGV